MDDRDLSDEPPGRHRDNIDKEGACSGLVLHPIQVGGQRFMIVQIDLVDEAILACLTDAEVEVARLMARGMTNRQIADARGTSRRTVVNQVSSIFEKLEVSSRAEFVRLMVEGEGLDRPCD